MKDKPIDIVFSSDSRYAQHLGVALISIFENAKSSTQIRIYVIDNGIHETDRLKLKKISEKYCFQLVFTPAKKKYSSAYQKMFIPEYFPYLDKILYLDCDIVVMEDIEELWKIDVSSHYLAATKDDWAANQLVLAKLKSQNYFNSGVMLLNLKKWRGDNITDKIEDTVISESYNHIFFEQNAINTVIGDEFIQLDPKYNQLPHLIMQKPIIVHFAGHKPWVHSCEHPQKKIYFKFKKISPWRWVSFFNGNFQNAKKYYLELLLSESALDLYIKTRTLFTGIRTKIGVFLKSKIRPELRRIVLTVYSVIQIAETIFLRAFTKETDGLVVIRTDHIGDFILFLPTFRLYKSAYPGKTITLIANQTCRELIERFRHSNIFDKIIYLDENKYKRNIYYRMAFTYRLAKFSYETLINPIYSRTEEIDLIVRLVSSRSKSGFECNKLDSIYTKLCPAPDTVKSEVEINTIFAKFLGITPIGDLLPCLDIDLNDQKSADRIIGISNIPDKYCILFPGAALRYKIWPLHKYVAVANFLVSKGITPVICGSIDELPMAREISNACTGCIVINGQTDIWTLAAILKQSRFYVGSDTGIMHLAASVKTPVICLMGGGYFGRFFPYGDPKTNRMVYDYHMKCKNDGWACVTDQNKPAPCIAGIIVENVTAEIDSLLTILDNKHES